MGPVINPVKQSKKSTGFGGSRKNPPVNPNFHPPLCLTALAVPSRRDERKGSCAGSSAGSSSQAALPERPRLRKDRHLHSPEPNPPMPSASKASSTFQWMALGSPTGFTLWGSALPWKSVCLVLLKKHSEPHLWRLNLAGFFPFFHDSYQWGWNNYSCFPGKTENLDKWWYEKLYEGQKTSQSNHQLLKNTFRKISIVNFICIKKGGH